MDLEAFQDRICHRFQDPSLLKQALSHPSVSHESGLGTQSNQRLEFLGDAVLQLVLTEELYLKFPEFDEGPLTKARAHMVNRQALASQARRISLGPCLLLSKGEEASGGRKRISALADGYEALVGAIFLDGGLDAVRGFVLREFHGAFGELKALPVLDNPKGELQELLQADSCEPPEYHLESATGPDHDRVFECAVFHRGVELGRGRDRSKKAAESRAAMAALQNLKAAEMTQILELSSEEDQQQPGLTQ